MPKAKYKVTITDLILEAHDEGGWNFREIGEWLNKEPGRINTLYVMGKGLGCGRKINRRKANAKYRSTHKEQIKQKRNNAKYNKTKWWRHKVQQEYERLYQAQEKIYTQAHNIPCGNNQLPHP